MSTVIITRPRPIPPSWKTPTSHHPSGAHNFVAIDGEGITLADGSHRYVLIRVGTNPPLENPLGLHWTAIFDYLYDHFEPGTAYVGFYLGYDFTQIFRSMRGDSFKPHFWWRSTQPNGLTLSSPMMSLP